MEYKRLARLAEQCGLVLGSGSPRRVRLLNEVGVAYRQVVPSVDETQNPGEPPFAYAQRLAIAKALFVLGMSGVAEPVIGCDTVVELNGRVLGKPEDESEAFGILSTLSGERHTVCTALAIGRAGRVLESGYELTRVTFRRVTSQQIRDYIGTGEPLDKAGAYGIQGMGAFLVDSVEGPLDNVIGLPRMLLDELAGRVLDCQ